MAERTVLLALAVETGYRLQESGAEIYRVEEAVRRIFQAYGVDGGQVFAIPNCLIVSLIDSDGRPISRMRRISAHGTDITRMERVYDYCRQICRETPDPDAALRQLRALDAGYPKFPFWLQLLGYFVGTGAFALFWGGSLTDGLVGGLCGIAIGLCLSFMERLGANLFVRTVISAFVSAFLAAVLERMKSVIGERRGLLHAEHAEHATLLMDLPVLIISHLSCPPNKIPFRPPPCGSPYVIYSSKIKKGKHTRKEKTPRTCALSVPYPKKPSGPIITNVLTGPESYSPLPLIS